MNDRLDQFSDVMHELLRPIVAELVAEAIDQQRRDRDRDEPHVPYLTVSEYARAHRATPAAVRARIRRGALHAFHPPGSREYLIPDRR